MSLTLLVRESIEASVEIEVRSVGGGGEGLGAVGVGEVAGASSMEGSGGSGDGDGRIADFGGSRGVVTLEVGDAGSGVWRLAVGAGF
jgi:hypothetical protein